MSSNLIGRSLKTRITLFTLAIFLAGIWSLAYYAGRMLREDMQRLLGEQQLSTATIVAAQVNEELVARAKALEDKSALIAPLLQNNAAGLQKELDKSTTLLGHFSAGVVAIDADGRAIAEIPRTIGIIGINLMERDHVSGALKGGRTTIGRPVMGKKLQAPLFAITVPVRDAHGTVIGALSGLTDLGKPNFLDKIAEGHYGRTGGYILSAVKSRLIVTATDKSRIMQPSPPPGVVPEIDRFIAGHEGYAVFRDHRGVEVLNATKRIPFADWNLVVTIPAADAFAPISAMQLRLLLATIVLTLLAGGLTWWMLKRQLEPMLAAAGALATLSKNQLPPQPLPVTSDDEIGELIKGFNHLLKTLAEREESLRESKDHLSAVFEASPIPIVVSRVADGKILDGNDAALRLYGLTREQAIGRTTAQLGTYADHLQRDEFVRRLRNHGGVDRFPLDFRRVSGETGVIEVSGRVVNFDGEQCVVTLLVDVTERNKTEETLRKTIAFADSLSEAMPLPVFHKDAAGRYTGCNSAYTRFIGKPRDQIVGKTVFEVFPPDYATSYRDRDLELFGDPTGMQTYESSVKRADGSIRDMIFHKARLTDGAGNPTGIVGVITEITELKQSHEKQAHLEAQLRESQKMEALGTLAGGVAHDFNNIVAAIIGNTELARQDVGPAHPALESLEEIGKASRRAKDLVQQILAFGRRQKPEREVISLSLVVEEAGALLRSTLPAGVALDIQCAPGVPAVSADATQIEQVVLNLCNNAWHAVRGTGQAGTIDIRLMPVERGSQFFACLTVRDNGRGMDEATRNRIFEPFFTTKPVGEGTGLGLSVVHGILREHEASIDVSSSPGGGTTFVILFPAAQAQAPAPIEPARKPKTAPVHGRGKRVLYVDDDESIVFLMTRLLERQGFQVSGYTDPDEAIAAVRARPDLFDLAVTDYNMPGMSGLDVTRALKGIRADLPVAMASGYITDELRAEAPAAGVGELIYKPNTVDDLCEAVARLALSREPLAAAS